jgi:hypothetical protein
MNLRTSVSQKTKYAAASIVVVALALILAQDAYGQAMSSSNYKLQSDSVNFGGVRSGSASFIEEDTLGEVATGLSSSTNYVMKAGYQQMQETVIAVVPASNVSMTPSIAGVTGGTSNGSTTFRVITDNPAGYTATIVASSSPALVSSFDSFADYVPSGANPDFTFSIAATKSAFAFSPEGTDIVQRFKDNGSACNVGSGDVTLSCWDGLSTSPITIDTRNSANHPTGIVTTLNFRAASGSNHIQVDGVYTATTTVTVLPL